MKINNLRHSIYGVFNILLKTCVCVCQQEDQMSHKTTLSPACLCFFEFCEKWGDYLNIPVTSVIFGREIFEVVIQDSLASASS